MAKGVTMSALNDNQQKPIAPAEEAEPGAAHTPDPAAGGAETDEPDLPAAQEPTAKRSVLVTVSDFVCAALACATSVR